MKLAGKPFAKNGCLSFGSSHHRFGFGRRTPSLADSESVSIPVKGSKYFGLCIPGKVTIKVQACAPLLLPNSAVGWEIVEADPEPTTSVSEVIVEQGSP